VTENFRFGSEADVTLSNFDVRFTPESGHQKRPAKRSPLAADASLI
jgi:hypothetical protein